MIPEHPTSISRSGSAKEGAYTTALRIGNLLGQKFADAIDRPSPVLEQIAGIGWLHSITVPADSLNLGVMSETARRVDDFVRAKERLEAFGIVVEDSVSRAIVNKIAELHQKGLSPKKILQLVQSPFATTRNLAFAHSDVLGQLLAKAEFALPTDVTDFADTMNNVGLFLPGLSKNTADLSDRVVEEVVEPISDRLQTMAAQMVRGTDLRFNETDESLESLNKRRGAFAEISSLLADEFLKANNGETTRNADLAAGYIAEAIFSYRVHYYGLKETLGSICQNLTDKGYELTASRVIERIVASKLISPEEIDENFLENNGFLQPKFRREILSRVTQPIKEREQLEDELKSEFPLNDIPENAILGLVVMTANITTIGHRSLGAGTEFALRTIFPSKEDAERIRILFSINHARRKEDNKVPLLPYVFRREGARIGLAGLPLDTTLLSTIDYYSDLKPYLGRVDPKQRINNFASRANRNITIFRSCGGERSGLTPSGLNLIVGPRDNEVSQLLYNSSYLDKLFGSQDEGTGKYVMFRQGPQYSSATDTYKAMQSASEGDRRAWIKVITRIHPALYKPLVEQMLRSGLIKSKPSFSLKS